MEDEGAGGGAVPVDAVDCRPEEVASLEAPGFSLAAPSPCIGSHDDPSQAPTTAAPDWP